MHSHHHLFEKIATLENLIAATHAALRGKRMPGAAFLADFEKEVFLLHEELWAGSYRHGGYTYYCRHRAAWILRATLSSRMGAYGFARPACGDLIDVTRICSGICAADVPRRRGSRRASARGWHMPNRGTTRCVRRVRRWRAGKE
ncbi:MAG: hypothetical protein WCJ35_27700 [Planctomycetota bacterium]